MRTSDNIVKVMKTRKVVIKIKSQVFEVILAVLNAQYLSFVIRWTRKKIEHLTFFLEKSDFYASNLRYFEIVQITNWNNTVRSM